MENPTKMDDLGVPLFLETPISQSFPDDLQLPCPFCASPNLLFRTCSPQSYQVSNTNTSLREQEIVIG